MLTGVYPKNMPVAQLDWLTHHLDAVHAAIPGGNYPSLIDVESFADHHILNVFANNADGLQVSTFYHKDRNGRVRMGPIWDFDRSMGCDNDARASNPEVWSLATDPLYFFHSAGPLWFRSLALNDAEFWMVWVDRWQAMREGPLSDAAMSGRIEGYRAEIGNAALRNYEKWSNVLSASAWSGKVDVMKNHVLTRARWIDDQLIDPPAFNHRGGLVSPGFQLSMTGPQTKYFTLNGGDPRAKGGSPAGTAYAGADHDHRQHPGQGARRQWRGICQRAVHLAVELHQRSDVCRRSGTAGDHGDHVSSATAAGCRRDRVFNIGF